MKAPLVTPVFVPESDVSSRPLESHVTAKLAAIGSRSSSFPTRTGRSAGMHEDHESCDWFCTDELL